jgi:flagellar biosynthetic protein FlhB
MGFLGFLDYLYQRHNHRQNLRMTKHEMKEEYKETEGSPEIKQKLRQLRMQGGRKRMIEAVPSATAVITNPTHYAIAVLWDEHTMTAPKVVAKGKNDIARRIREVAQQHNIPIVENPPLARSLYSGVDLEREIEPQHYQAVAEVIRFVMALKAKRF